MSNNRELGYVVGAVAGYFTGGASYIALGATIGGAIGGLLDPNAKTSGPRLDDLKVQMSTYGVGIPHLYGTQRIAPNVVWSTNKIEKSSTTTSGGKGGGGVDNTSYRYYVQMRQLLCETPLDGSTVNIVQIFQDGKLIYDARTGIPVASALASAENPYAFFTLYQGHADQLPDPVEELYESGPGSVPAYRGVVSISMKAIECPGGRVPQFSFVLSNKSNLTATVDEMATFPAALSVYATAVVKASNIWHYEQTVAASPDNLSIKSYSASTGAGVLERTISVARMAGSIGNIKATPINGAYMAPEVFAVDTGTGNQTTFTRINLETGEQSAFYTADFSADFPSGLGGQITGAAYDPISDKYVIGILYETGASRPIYILPDGLRMDATVGIVKQVGFYNGIVYALLIDSGVSKVARFNANDGSLINVITGPATSSVTVYGGDSDAMYVSDQGVYIRIGASGGETTYKVTTAYELLATTGDLIATLAPAGFYADDNISNSGPSFSGSTAIYSLVRHRAIVTDECLVSAIIAAECEQAGETRYDVSDIPDTDTVRGYVIASPASARANIDPLLTAFQIFIVDEDGSIKFKKYSDIASVATIAFDELGQAEDGAQSSDAMPLARTQEIDLPRSVSVSYIEPLNDYQVATETESRQVTEATEDMLVQLPMALASSDQAKRAATAILFSRWRSQNTRTLTVSRKYAFLSPGDGVTVEYPRATFRLWRITSMTDTGAVIELSVEPGDASLYTQTAVGTTGYVGQQVEPLASPTRLQLLDSPILKDEDNNAGIYAAMMRAPGELFIGNDDASLITSGATTYAATGGAAEGILGAFSMNIMDETNTLIVNVGTGELNSTTRALLYTTTVNAALVGAQGRWEVIQYLRATSLGSGRYLLSGLLRGLRGTERNRSNHTDGDVFVSLALAGILRANLPVGDIGTTKSFRGVAKGRGINSVASQTYANTAEGLKPFAPWDARRYVASTNDQTLTWKRRTRMSSNALRGTVPLGETTESYSVDFYTSSAFTTLAGTLTSTTPTLTITSAQQTAFGLTPGAPLYRRIYQVSESVGRGAPLEAST